MRLLLHCVMGLLHNGDVAAVAGYEEVGIYRKAATNSRVVKLIQELKTGQLSIQVGVLCCAKFFTAILGAGTGCRLLLLFYLLLCQPPHLNRHCSFALCVFVCVHMHVDVIWCV